MAEPVTKCMICAKPVDRVRGGICEPCQERIRREALGEQSDTAERAKRELSQQGIGPIKK